MKKRIKHILLLFCLVAVLIIPFFVFAEQTAPLSRLSDLQENSGYNPATEFTIAEVIGYIVQGVLSLLGIIFVILMVYGGYTWMTAAGDEGKVTKATAIIRRAIIGLIITAGSYAIWAFIFNQIIK